MPDLMEIIMANNKNEKEYVGADGSYQVKKSKKLNVFAFIACVLAALLIWIYVMNTQNDGYTKTFSLKVDVLNAEELLEERDLSVFDIPKKDVTITIRGKKTDVQKYIEKDFRAYLDLSTIKEKGDTTLNVAVETPSAALSVVAVEPSSVNVYVDTMTSKVLVPNVKCVKEDKLALSLAPDNPTIEISGPTTYIEKISYVEVVIPYSETYNVGDSVTTSDIRLYASDDTRVSTKYMTFLKDSVIVRVELINE